MATAALDKEEDLQLQSLVPGTHSPQFPGLAVIFATHRLACAWSQLVFRYSMSNPSSVGRIHIGCRNLYPVSCTAAQVIINDLDAIAALIRVVGDGIGDHVAID